MKKIGLLLLSGFLIGCSEKQPPKDINSIGASGVTIEEPFRSYAVSLVKINKGGFADRIGLKEGDILTYLVYKDKNNNVIYCSLLGLVDPNHIDNVFKNLLRTNVKYVSLVILRDRNSLSLKLKKVGKDWERLGS